MDVPLEVFNRLGSRVSRKLLQSISKSAPGKILFKTLVDEFGEESGRNNFKMNGIHDVQTFNITLPEKDTDSELEQEPVFSNV